MKLILSGSMLLLLATTLTVVAKDPEVTMVDGKMSIQAEAVTLKQFLQAFDAATGMKSKVSPQLANEKISVRLTGVDVATAIRKSFQGQPWNYTVAIGVGINMIDKATLTAASTTGSTSPVQPYITDTRSDIAPPLPNSAPFAQAGPVPAPGAAPTAATGNQPAVLNLPPAQGGSSAPAPLFQPAGSSLGAPLPTSQPGR